MACFDQMNVNVYLLPGEVRADLFSLILNLQVLAEIPPKVYYMDDEGNEAVRPPEV